MSPNRGRPRSSLKSIEDRLASGKASNGEQRARNFADAAAAYRCLRAVVELRH